MERVAGKLGKSPARPRLKDIRFGEVVPAGVTLKQAPVGFGHYQVIPADGWGMLGNDDWGDCAWAGPGHETEMITAMNGTEAVFDTASVLSDYSAGTGFDPNAGPPGDNPTDQGSDVHDVLNYRIKTGIVDASGNRHKIGAFVSLEPGNWGQMLEALYAFDFVGIGIKFPSYAMAQFGAGKPWSYQPGDDNPDEGHYIPIVGRPHAWTVDVVTWGQIQAMGRRFFEHYNDETYGMLTVETLNGQGRTPEGLTPVLEQAIAAALGKL